MTEENFESAGPAAGAENTIVDADGNIVMPSDSMSSDGTSSDSSAALTKDDKLWAMFCHLGGLVLNLLGGVGVIAPLVIWLIKKDDSSFVDDQGKEALNFHLTLFIFYVACVILVLVTFGIGVLVVLPVGLIVWLASMVLSIIASIQAYDGKRYRYPATLRLIT